MFKYVVTSASNAPLAFDTFKAAEEYLLGQIRSLPAKSFHRTITEVTGDGRFDSSTTYRGRVNIDKNEKTITITREAGYYRPVYHTETLKVKTLKVNLR